MLKIKIGEKIRTHFMLSNLPPPPPQKIVSFNAEKYSAAGQATDDDTAHAHCLLNT